jgi:hypothetical protein
MVQAEHRQKRTKDERIITSATALARAFLIHNRKEKAELFNFL